MWQLRFLVHRDRRVEDGDMVAKGFSDGGNIGNSGAVYTDFHQGIAIFQGDDRGQFRVLIHNDIVQTLQVCQWLQGCQCVGRTLDIHQRAIFGEGRQLRHLIVGEVKIHQLRQGRQRSDVGDTVVGNIQFTDAGTGRQSGYIGKAVEGDGQSAKIGQRIQSFPPGYSKYSRPL